MKNNNIVIICITVLTLVLIMLLPAIPQSKKEVNESSNNATDVLTYPDYDNLSGTELIAMAQNALKNEGFDPGPVDGIFGPQTRNAIEAFQRAHNLPPTGELDERTRYLLFWSF